MHDTSPSLFHISFVILVYIVMTSTIFPLYPTYYPVGETHALQCLPICHDICLTRDTLTPLVHCISRKPFLQFYSIKVYSLQFSLHFFRERIFNKMQIYP